MSGRWISFAMVLVLLGLLWPKSEWAGVNLSWREANQVAQPSSTSQPFSVVVDEATLAPGAATGSASPSFYDGLLDQDPYCLDVARGAYFRCVHMAGVVCAQQSTCPPKLIDSPPPHYLSSSTAAPGDSVVHARAHRIQSIIASGGPSAVHHIPFSEVAANLPAGGQSGAVAKYAFCRFRDAFIQWNATAMRMMALCRGIVGTVMESSQLDCGKWTAFITSEMDKVRRHSATEHELAESTGPSLGDSWAPEDVTALAQALAQLPSSPSGDGEALLTALLRTTRGGGHEALIKELGVESIAKEAAEQLAQEEAAARQQALEERDQQAQAGVAASTGHVRTPKGFLGEVSASRERQRDWGCHRSEYPVVRIAVVGEPVLGSFHVRLQRLIDSMCTYCRGAAFTVRVQPFLEPEAGVVASEGVGEPYHRSKPFAASGDWAPDVVIVTLGVIDAVKGTDSAAKIAAGTERLVRGYQDLPSKPDIIVVLPHQVFDAELEGRRHVRVKRLFIGEHAQRMQQVVIPALRLGVERAARRASRNASEDDEHPSTIQVVDFNRVHLRWLRRVIHEATGGSNATNSPGVMDPEPTEGQDPLAMFPVAAHAAQKTLLRVQADGHTFGKNIQKLLGVAVFHTLFGSLNTATKL